MSRSHRHSSCAKICGSSDKESKRETNRRFRSIERMLMHMLEYDRLPMSTREISDNWLFASDGLAYWMQQPTETDLYWTIDDWKRMMRK